MATTTVTKSTAKGGRTGGQARDTAPHALAKTGGAAPGRTAAGVRSKKQSVGDGAAEKAVATKQRLATATESGKAGDKRASKDVAKRAEQPAGKHTDKQAIKRDDKRDGKQNDKQADKSAKKQKVIRDSFTMPKADYEHIAQLKQTCLSEGVEVRKSELLRAGLNALRALPISELLTMVASVETVKTGRPPKQ